MQIFLELVILITLLCTIWFCWRLHNRIIELKSNRKEIMSLIQTFDAALVTTHRNIAELKETTTTAATTLKTQIQKSEEMVNDLYFIVDIGEKLASKLDRNVINAKETISFLQHSLEHSANINIVKKPKQKPKSIISNPQQRKSTKNHDNVMTQKPEPRNINFLNEIEGLSDITSDNPNQNMKMPKIKQTKTNSGIVTNKSANKN